MSLARCPARSASRSARAPTTTGSFRYSAKWQPDSAMTPPSGQNPLDTGVRALRGLLHGYVASQGIFVVAELGIADHLATGPVECSELARRTGTHAPSLYRLMRAMASV